MKKSNAQPQALNANEAVNVTMIQVMQTLAKAKPGTQPEVIAAVIAELNSLPLAKTE